MSNLQEEFRDIHKGKMGFLLGTGVSLDTVDTDRLKPYVTVGINGSLFKMPDPDYLFTCDGGITLYGLLGIVSKDTTLLIAYEGNFSEGGIQQISEAYSIPKYSAIRRKVSENSKESATMRAEDDKLIFGLSSVHCAAHLMYIMGCNPIVLLGCDCKMTNGLYSFWMLPQYRDKLTPSYIDEAGNANLPHPTGYRERIYKDIPGYLSSFKNYWEKMKQYAPTVPIIDACDSEMSCFPKMSLDKVLEIYGDLKK